MRVRKINKKERNKRNSCIPTCVRGIRAENTFWEKCDCVAKVEETTRNELVVRVVSKYLDGVK